MRIQRTTSPDSDNTEGEDQVVQPTLKNLTISRHRQAHPPMATMVRLVSILALLFLSPASSQITESCDPVPLPSDGWCRDAGCFNSGSVCQPCLGCSVSALRDASSHPIQCRQESSYPWFCAGNTGTPATAMIVLQELPHFVKNFTAREGKHRHVFFNEVSSYVNYARLGKVCSKEWGTNQSQWTTFQMATLRCTSPSGDDFTYLSDVTLATNQSNGHPLYFAAFTQNNGESALCVYRQKEIDTHMWTTPFANPVASTLVAMDIVDVPYKNAGRRCGGADLTDWEITFSRTHSLLVEPIDSTYFLLAVSGGLTRLVHHVTMANDGRNYNVIFAAFEDGRLLKVVQLWNNTVNVLEEILVTPDPARITDLEIRGNQTEQTLHIQWVGGTHQIPLHRCINMSGCACVQDPYCVWNNKTNICDERNSQNRGEQYVQAVENVQLCSRAYLNESLLVTSYRRPPTTTTVRTSTTVQTTQTTTTPESSLVDQPSPPDNVWGIVAIFVMILIMAVVIFVVAYLICSSRSKSLLLPELDWYKIRTTWTSIEVCPSFWMPRLSGQWKIVPWHADANGPKGFLWWRGITFTNVLPLTEYIIYRDEEKVDAVRTKGPSIRVDEDSITEDSVRLEMISWDHQYGCRIILDSEVNSCSRAVMGDAQSGVVDASFMTINGLLPNVDYTIQLVLESGDIVGVGRVKTKAESFWIEHDGTSAILRWARCSRGITRLLVKGCCSHDWQEVDPLEGRLDLGILPDVNDLTIDVNGRLDSDVQTRLSDGTYKIGEVLYSAAADPTSNYPPCSAPLMLLQNLRVMPRKELADLVALSLLVFETFCSTLGYDSTRTDIFYKHSPYCEERFLAAVNEWDEHVVQTKTLHTLMEDFLRDFEALKVGYGQIPDCRQYHLAMEAILKLHHVPCEACEAVVKVARHLSHSGPSSTVC